MTTDKNSQIIEIEKQLQSKGLSFSFSSLSETNGTSIYYNVEGINCRFSNHSVTSKSRLENEAHFKLPFEKQLGLGGLIKEVYNNNETGFKIYFNR